MACTEETIDPLLLRPDLPEEDLLAVASHSNAPAISAPCKGHQAVLLIIRIRGRSAPVAGMQLVRSPVRGHAVPEQHFPRGAGNRHKPFGRRSEGGASNCQRSCPFVLFAKRIIDMRSSRAKIPDANLPNPWKRNILVAVG